MMNIQQLDEHLSAHAAFRQNTCPRCNGRGFLEVYRHVENGVCFLCRGEGVYSGPISDHSSLKSQITSEASTKRWFLGYLSTNDRTPKQIFAFTADDLQAGKARADRELAALGYPDSPKPDGYYLIIGGIDETKQELIARYGDYLRGVQA